MISPKRKFAFLYNSNPIYVEISLISEVRQKINNYLRFIDSYSLLKNTESLIFGGAVRDSIAGFDIHDIDILVLPNSLKIIEDRLQRCGFQIHNCCSVDIASLYFSTTISEPRTWIKDNIFIQLIRPRIKTGESISQKYLVNIARNVDISCCGVSFFPEDKLAENVEGAIEDCQQKTYSVIQNAILNNSNRILHRCAKLDGRGWKRKNDITIANHIVIDTVLRNKNFNETGMIGSTGIQGSEGYTGIQGETGLSW